MNCNAYICSVKRLLLIISVLLFINVTSAQGEKDTLDYFCVSELQHNEWSEIEYMWSINYFNPFLKKHELKTSCSHCYSINFEVLFWVNKKGKSKATLISNYVCGKKFKMKQENEFPKVCFNGAFKFKSGRMLKC